MANDGTFLPSFGQPRLSESKTLIKGQQARIVTDARFEPLRSSRPSASPSCAISQSSNQRLMLQRRGGAAAGPPVSRRLLRDHFVSTLRGRSSRSSAE